MRIAAVTDHPLTTTGFANASRPYLEAMHEAGHEVIVLGRLLTQSHAFAKDYTVWGTNHLDEMGTGILKYFLETTKPDFLWSMTDPGNFDIYLNNGLGEYLQKNKTKVLTYHPVEGRPLTYNLARTFEATKSLSDCKNVLWTKCAEEELNEQSEIKHVSDGYIYFGVDERFYPYPEEDKQKLKRLFNLEDIFVIGSVGTNKRTKGMAEMLFVAQDLLRNDSLKNYVFYQHTNPKQALDGCHLESLAKSLDVKGVVLWPPRTNLDRSNNYWKGIPLGGSILETSLAKELLSQKSITMSESGVAIDMASINDIYNMMDLYLDMSQVEGWGMPQLEAQACGVPVLGPKDNWARDELMGCSRITFHDDGLWQPLNVWKNGSNLVTIDLQQATYEIESILKNEYSLPQVAQSGLENVKKFDWEESKKKMIMEIETI